MIGINQFIIGLFIIVYITFIVLSRKTHSFIEYSVAGRKVGSFLVFSSLAASMIGPAYTMGIVKESYSQGLYYYLSIGLVGFNYLIMTVFAKKIYWKFPDAITAGDMISGPSGHNSRIVKLVIGCLTFVHMTLICIMLTKSIGVVLLTVFEWPENVSIPITIGIVTAYSYFGGIRATIQTDAAQFVIFIILIPALIIAMINESSFEVSSYIDSATNRFIHNASEFDLKSYFEAASAWILLGLFGPATINRVLISKNEVTAQRGFGGASLFMFIWMLLMVVIGDIGYFLMPDEQVSDGLLLRFAQTHYNSLTFSLFVVAILGVIMSTHDTILNTAAVILSEDVLNASGKALTDESKLKYSKAAIIAIGLLSIVGAQYIGSIIGVMILIVSLVMPAYLPSMFFSIILKRPFWLSSIASIVMGLTSTLYWRTYHQDSFVPPLIFGLVISFPVYVLIYLAMGRKKQSVTSPDQQNN